jgi:protein phosphatase
MSRGFRVVAVSHVGMVRQGNEDAGVASTRLLAVADGMGGHAAGEVASSSVIHSIADELHDLPRHTSSAREWLLHRVNFAHASVGDLVADNPERRGMGTTLSALIACEDGVVVGHVGDSRIYHLQGQNLHQITIDHTYVQLLVSEAHTHPRKNLLMRAIDGIHEVEMDISEVQAADGDRFLLCSDGLSGVVDDAYIAKVLTQPDLTLAASSLLELAIAAGAPDNVTVIIGQYGEHDVDVKPFLVGAAAQEKPHVHVAESKRARWSIIAAAVFALVIGGAAFASQWVNSQWFVGTANGHLAIYKGIKQQIGPFDLARVESEYVQFPSASMSLIDQQNLVDGISVHDWADGYETIQAIVSRSSMCELSSLGCPD